MRRFSWSRCRNVGLVVGALGAVISLVIYHFSAQEYETRTLIESVKQYSAESFESYQYAVRPMFACSRRLGLNVWRKDRRRFLTRIEQELNKHSRADEVIKHAVEEFVWAVKNLSLPCQTTENSEEVKWERENLVTGLRRIDKSYEAFSKASEKYDVFVPLIRYEVQYK